jgi:hypothetical protein
MEEYESGLGLLAAEQRRRAVREGLAREVSEIRRRLQRLEQEVAKV